MLEEIEGGIGGYSLPILDFDCKYFLFIYKMQPKLNIFNLFAINELKIINKTILNKLLK